MKQTIALAAFLALSAAADAGQSWTGRISDSLCKAKHEETAEGAGAMADHDCTVACVRGGSKYVLISDGKVLQIANQSYSDLPKFAGQDVIVSGDLTGDTLTLTKIEPAKR
jgi:hypothetical protein